MAELTVTIGIGNGVKVGGGVGEEMGVTVAVGVKVDVGVIVGGADKSIRTLEQIARTNMGRTKAK